MEIYRPDNDKESGIWTFDETTGIITILYDGSQCTSKHIFDDTAGPACFYGFNDEPHIPPERDSIVAHHACKKLILVRQMRL